MVHLVYSVREQINNIFDICLVMSTTLIDPTQQEDACEADVPTTPAPSTTAELPDPSTYKVYRPPDVSSSTSSKRQCKVTGYICDSLLTDLCRDC